MRARARRLGPDDMTRIVAFLDQDPIANLPLRQRLFNNPPQLLGQEVVRGYEVEGELIGLCHYGAILNPVGAYPEALDAFAESAGFFRRAASIVGRSDSALGLYHRLIRRWGWSWEKPRNIRVNQPLMVWRGISQVAPEPTLRQLTEAEFDSYFEASVHMYTEEIGVSPLEGGGEAYAQAVRHRLRSGNAYGVVRDGQVLFKADLGIVFAGEAQIQGVWMAPALRGRGLAAAAMTAFVKQVSRRYPKLSLYVNDFNLPAIRAYLRSGFEPEGSMSTVHY